jgi:hypothetical protein
MEHIEWRTLLTATAFDTSTSQQEPQKIGKGVAFTVSRELIRESWRERMDEPDEEFKSPGIALFNKHGYFLKEHPIKKGTVCLVVRWGAENCSTFKVSMSTNDIGAEGWGATRRRSASTR